MNVNATTPVAGVPCTDAPAASADPSAGSAGAFAAILDAASVNDAGSGPARAARDSQKDTDPAAGDIAAIAAASLLAIAQMAPPVEDAQDDDTSESSSDSVGDVSTESAPAHERADASAQQDTEISVKTVVDASGNASAGAPPDEVPPARVPDVPPYVPSPRYDPAPPYDPGGDIQTTTATQTTTTRAVETAATNAASSTRPAAEATTSPSRATAEAASGTDRRDVRESTTTAVGTGRDVVDPGVDRAAREPERAASNAAARETERAALNVAVRETERAASNVASARNADSRRIASDAALPWYPRHIYQPDPDAQTTQSDQRAAEQAGQSTVALPSIGDVTSEHETEPPRAGSAASRFARAVERASSGIVPQPRTENAAANDGATGQGGTQQDARGQSFADRAAQPIALPRGESAHGPVFTLAAPTSWDLRGVGAADAAIATGEGARIEIPDRDVVMQVVQSMRLQFRDGIGEAVLKLKPEHLGTVSILLRIENGAVSAHVHAGVGEVRQWLESNQSMLRDSLAEQGLRLERFVVESEEKRDGSTDDNADRGQSRRRRSPRPRAGASDQPIFEVLA